MCVVLLNNVVFSKIVNCRRITNLREFEDELERLLLDPDRRLLELLDPDLRLLDLLDPDLRCHHPSIWQTKKETANTSNTIFRSILILLMLCCTKR